MTDVSEPNLKVEVREWAHDEEEPWWDTSVQYFTAMMQVDSAFVGSVPVNVTPRDSVAEWHMWRLEEADAGWLIEFDRVDIDRDHAGRRYGLWLVADTLRQLSRGRACVASIVAEPRSWQSMKQRDRGPAITALDRHWSKLGFSSVEVRPDVQPHTMWIAVRDYEPPPILVLPPAW